MNITIYHNPHCSKSRTALELIRSRGIEPTIVDYLKNPPTPSELEALLNRLALEPRALIRTNEPEYRQLGLDDPNLDRPSLLAALHRTPRLIERPIVLVGTKAIIARPPERVLELL